MLAIQDGRTALSVAVTCESESAAKLVTLLIDNGANPNQSDKDGMSPLLIAAFEGKAQVCYLGTPYLTNLTGTVDVISSDASLESNVRFITVPSNI